MRMSPACPEPMRGVSGGTSSGVSLTCTCPSTVTAAPVQNQASLPSMATLPPRPRPGQPPPYAVDDFLRVATVAVRGSAQAHALDAHVMPGDGEERIRHGLRIVREEQRAGVGRVARAPDLHARFEGYSRQAIEAERGVAGDEHRAREVGDERVDELPRVRHGLTTSRAVMWSKRCSRPPKPFAA